MSNYVNLRYVSSQGVEFLFQESTIVKTKTANFHNYTWSPQVLKQIYGGRLMRIEKEPITYHAELYVRGAKADRIAFLDSFHAYADQDIATAKAGRLYWDDMYIECFVISSSTYPAESGYTTVDEVDFFCPYPSWLLPTLYYSTSAPLSASEIKAIFKNHSAEATQMQTFPADVITPPMYPLLPSRNAVLIMGAGYADCSINGAHRAITDVAGGQGLPVNLTSGQYAFFDSRDYSVVFYNGQSESDALSIRMNPDVFSKISVAEEMQITMDWDEQLSPSTALPSRVAVVIFYERSEPTWI